MKRRSIAFWAAASLIVFPLLAIAADFSGAGATFPYPIYANWADKYKRETGNALSYKPIGSTGGLQAIVERSVTFGATDVPLAAQELAESGNLIQWPMVMGAIVPIVNLDGLRPNEITLDGSALAKIYLGEIKTWDAPALKKLNPHITLPSLPIVVVHRSDGSGTTYNFAHYLSKVSEAWKTKIGAQTSVVWPVGIGVKGNQGVADEVRRTKGAIGFVEAAYATQNALTTTKMINRSGKPVEATGASVRAAAANWWWSSLDWAGSGGFYVMISDQRGDAAWPISAMTFILMPAEVNDAEAAREALKFFAWAFAHGDDAAKELDYVPMPLSIKHLVMQKWAAIKGPGGQPILDLNK